MIDDFKNYIRYIDNLIFLFEKSCLFYRRQTRPRAIEHTDECCNHRQNLSNETKHNEIENEDNHDSEKLIKAIQEALFKASLVYNNQNNNTSIIVTDDKLNENKNANNIKHTKKPVIQRSKTVVKNQTNGKFNNKPTYQNAPFKTDQRNIIVKKSKRSLNKIPSKAIARKWIDPDCEKKYDVDFVNVLQETCLSKNDCNIQNNDLSPLGTDSKSIIDLGKSEQPKSYVYVCSCGVRNSKNNTSNMLFNKFIALLRQNQQLCIKWWTAELEDDNYLLTESANNDLMSKKVILFKNTFICRLQKQFALEPSDNLRFTTALKFRYNKILNLFFKFVKFLHFFDKFSLDIENRFQFCQFITQRFSRIFEALDAAFQHIAMTFTAIQQNVTDKSNAHNLEVNHLRNEKEPEHLLKMSNNDLLGQWLEKQHLKKNTNKSYFFTEEDEFGQIFCYSGLQINEGHVFHRSLQLSSAYWLELCPELLSIGTDGCLKAGLLLAREHAKLCCDIAECRVELAWLMACQGTLGKWIDELAKLPGKKASTFRWLYMLISNSSCVALKQSP